MTTISAKVVLASRHALVPDKILYTMLLRYPRWIHAEFMTHRALSRNASSSRAIPVKKLIQNVLDDPAIPLFWGANQKGMRASEECNELVDVWSHDLRVGFHDRVSAWLFARDRAIESARAFAKAGYHKQIVNRLLEPFSHITVVVSGAEWSNFFALRCHPDAEPHIRMLAEEMFSAMAGAEVQTLRPGEWHLPFFSEEDDWREINGGGVVTEDQRKACIKLSVARCASTSYKTVDGFDMTLERAVALHDKLVSSVPLHASPCEHVAQADEQVDYWEQISQTRRKVWTHPEQHGNFVGFRQYRKQLVGECQ